MLHVPVPFRLIEAGAAPCADGFSTLAEWSGFRPASRRPETIDGQGRQPAAVSPRARFTRPVLGRTPPQQT